MFKINNFRPESIDLPLCEHISDDKFDSSDVYENGDFIAFRYVGNEIPTKINDLDYNLKGNSIEVITNGLM